MSHWRIIYQVAAAFTETGSDSQFLPELSSSSRGKNCYTQTFLHQLFPWRASLQKNEKKTKTFGSGQLNVG